ncbi:MAG TPA: GIY-YIG nuclease family protein [Gemmatimonadaceae bacterium]|nr:GIY-YIG nuclease family protein [Gemmatimonadaceae bacterium]
MRRLSKVKALLLTPKSTDAHVATMRAHVRATAKDRPGVYRWLSADGEVVYVGKSKRLRTRLLSYFRCGSEEKGSRIVREATSIEWEYAPSEFAALLEELRLIKRFRPRLNVAMKRDARNFCFIKLTRGAAPKLLVVRGAGADDAQIYYGPFNGAQRVTEAVRELNDALGLRDCRLDQPMHFADQPELFQIFPRTPGCIRHEIRKCLGPCVGGCTTAEYDQRVALVRAFLDGADDGPLEMLRAEMEGASAALEFERAAVLRDKLARLEGLREQFIRFRFAVETLSFVYTVPGHEGDDRVYLIRRGRVRGECALPRTEHDRMRLLAMVEDVFSPAERETTQLPSHEVDELLLLSSWFRRFPAELARSRQSAEFVAAPPALGYDAASDPLFGDSAASPAA